MFSIEVVEGDILNRACDLLILKHADGFYGVDQIVAEKMDFRGDVPRGRHRIVPGRHVEARNVAFFGVGTLAEFEYSQIRSFARDALLLVDKLRDVRRVCMPIHGPGYGLDEAEAFSSLIAGLVDAYEKAQTSSLERVEIVEINPGRARRFRAILESLLDVVPSGRKSPTVLARADAKIQQALKSFGSNSELKTRLFVAMPFKEEFNDEWEISIQEAASSLHMISERIDKSAFVGDIAVEIKRRIEDYDGLVALLNGANPNVFLEIGYAWAKGKPTILLIKEGQELPFDVRGQRCIFYKGIADLRTKLSAELAQLETNGIFRRR